MLACSLATVGFQGAAPLVQMPSVAAASPQMSAINVGDVGTTRPLGVFDPLGLMTKMPEKYRRCVPTPRLPPPRSALYFPPLRAIWSHARC